MIYRRRKLVRRAQVHRAQRLERFERVADVRARGEPVRRHQVHLLADQRLARRVNVDQSCVGVQRAEGEGGGGAGVAGPSDGSHRRGHGPCGGVVSKAHTVERACASVGVLWIHVQFGREKNKININGSYNTGNTRTSSSPARARAAHESAHTRTAPPRETATRSGSPAQQRQQETQPPRRPQRPRRRWCSRRSRRPRRPRRRRRPMRSPPRALQPPAPCAP